MVESIEKWGVKIHISKTNKHFNLHYTISFND
jgi:hypothetical protein